MQILEETCCVQISMRNVASHAGWKNSIPYLCANATGRSVKHLFCSKGLHAHAFSDKRKETWFKRKEIKILFFFLFLPRKERDISYLSKACCTWDLLCLKLQGGVHLHAESKDDACTKARSFCFLRYISSRFSIRVGVILNTYNMLAFQATLVCGYNIKPIKSFVRFRLCFEIKHDVFLG